MRAGCRVDRALEPCLGVDRHPEFHRRDNSEKSNTDDTRSRIAGQSGSVPVIIRYPMLNIRRRSYVGVVCVALSCAAAACAKNPSAPTGAPTAAPTLFRPLNGSLVAHQTQPVTLIVENATGSKPGTTYTFEVASDVAFTTKVQTKDVPEGTTGQTTVQLDPLPAAKDYFWRARAQAPGTTGTFSDLFKFTVGAAVTLGTPTAISPLTNAETTPRPTLRVTNASRTGATGAITYKFDIARDLSFNAVVLSGTNAEGVNETGFIVASDLPLRVPLFWRATATDTANAVSTSSPVQSFTALPYSQAETIALQLGVPLWSGRVPPGSAGHATMGDNWQIQTLHYLPGNVFFQSPDIEMLRIFDLLDRGFDPDGAIGWMRTNGYPNAALWYPPPEKAVIGLHYVYLASRNKIVVNGTWEVVLRVE